MGNDRTHDSIRGCAADGSRSFDAWFSSVSLVQCGARWLGGCMRALVTCAVLVLSGCATERATIPREYLDDSTASTITIVASPWILTRTGAPPQLDLLHLYAVDVNQTGRHGRYLAMIQYWPAATSTHGESVALVLNLSDTKKRLEPITDDPGRLGIGQPLDEAAP